MSTIDEKLSAAELKAARSASYRDKLLIIKTAEAEIPAIWDTGQVTLVALAKNYGISPMTVRRILRDAGRNTQRFRKLTAEEREEICGHLKQGATPDELSAAYRVSVATIRRAGIEGGAIDASQRQPRRSDEDYLMIQNFETEARARFGAGLYSLGMGLRAWQARKRKQAEKQQAAAWQEPELPTPPPTPQPMPEPAPQPAPEPQPEPAPVVFGDGQEDAAAVVGPFAGQAEQKQGFSF